MEIEQEMADQVVKDIKSMIVSENFRTLAKEVDIDIEFR